jgi:hypothetical protein
VLHVSACTYAIPRHVKQKPYKGRNNKNLRGFGSAFNIPEPIDGIILTGNTNLNGNLHVAFITKQTALIQSNKTQIYFNSNCYKKI